MTITHNKFFRGAVIALTLFFALSQNLNAQSGMTDKQIVEYVKKRVESGADQKEIAKELLRKGVTPQQLQRLKQKYEKMKKEEKSGSSSKNLKNLSSDDNRTRKNNGEERDEDLDDILGDIELPEKKIYGHDIFRNKSLSFEPNMNIATPVNYVLGPGDEVTVDIYGASQSSNTYKVSPDGSITIDDVGPVYVSGLTAAKAQARVRSRVGQYYQGSQVKLSVGQTRTIAVNVLGEVTAPGTYSLSAFSTVFNALYLAGGVTDTGTLREIKVTRKGKVISKIDVYDYLVNGKLAGNVMLQDNDAIIVGPYENLVEITGHVKRPMFYEMKKDESLEALLKYAGGFTGDALKNSIHIERKSSEGQTVYSVNEKDFASFTTHDGDSIYVEAAIERYKNMLSVSGAVFFPGKYQLSKEVNSVKSLLKQAGGLTEDAFINRGVLYRMKENRTRMAMTIDIAGITKDTAPDVLLQNEDSLVIASTEEINKKKMIYVYGEVFVPGEQPYAEGLTIEDAIVSAGGLKETATTLNVEVSRMLIYTHTKDSTYNTQAKVYQFTLKDGLPINEGSKFTLQPGDMVSIHRSPEYQQQQRITVNGEVLYAGTYTLTGKNERLSSVIKRAGGLTAAAAGANARLIRKMTPEERERKIQLVEIERRSLMQDKEKTQSLSLDSTDIKKLKIKEYYNVGIDLDKAMKNPGCSEDVVLRDSDQIIIPQHDYTVRINGEVLYSNTVSYVKGKRGSYYLNQAGGVSKTGDKKKAYVIYANGQVSRLSKGKVMPGCEIVVPTKQKKETNMQNTSLLISAASVLATVAAVLISALK